MSYKIMLVKLFLKKYFIEFMQKYYFIMPDRQEQVFEKDEDVTDDSIANLSTV